MRPSVAVVTIVHRRHDHLVEQLRGLASGTRQPDLQVVVAMDDDAIEDVVSAVSPHWPVRVVPVARDSGHLPLAHARNVGVAEAMTARCAQLVLLDVDCIPSNDLVQRYCEGMQAFSTTGPDIPRVLCGEVLYLPPLPEEVRPSDPARLDTARTHPARPVLASGTTQTEKDLTLFWSLSFATTTAHWYTLGGFDEAFVGYGGEDTDFGQRLRQAGGEMVWIGGARAYHQYHEVERPPLQHLEDIVRNANLFATRWGWWPMEGWLEGFRMAGLTSRSQDGRWHVVTPTGPRARP